MPCLCSAWNQKYLDYEIETASTVLLSLMICPPLEIKSISITRLKPAFGVFNGEPSVAWNQKYLDYEIETRNIKHFSKLGLTYLKSKVSRLRDWNVDFLSVKRLFVRDLKSKVSRLRDWNGENGRGSRIKPITWNQKYLDYEIETKQNKKGKWTGKSLEIKSISITRLKRWRNPYQPKASVALKSKVSRLRDWNEKKSADGRIIYRDLEIKSISITRLKLSRNSVRQISRF